MRSLQLATLALALMIGASAANAATYNVYPVGWGPTSVNETAATPKEAYLKFWRRTQSNVTLAQLEVRTWCAPRYTTHIVLELGVNRKFYGHRKDLRGMATGCK